jgi:hypothetical protein
LSDEIKYFTPIGSQTHIPYAAPHDTSGLLPAQPKAVPFQVRAGSIRPILDVGRIRSLSAGHESTFQTRVARYAPSADEALHKRMRQVQERNNALFSQGESNRVLPDRGTFSADKTKRKEIRSSFTRGDVVVHMAGHKRLTIMGPSRSKPGYLKAVDSDGNTYRVSPKNIVGM